MTKRLTIAILLAGMAVPAVQLGTVATDPIQTAAIPAAAPIAAKPVGLLPVLKAGLDALKADDLINARAIRNSMPNGSLDRHILQWAIALSGDKSVPSSEIAKAATDLPGWPGLSALRRNSERALYRENPAPQLVIAAFGASAPRTAQGAIILARAQLAAGNVNAAKTALVPQWRSAVMDEVDENAILGEFAALLTSEDHYIRMATMLYAERKGSAARVAALAGAEPLYKAWSGALGGDAKTTDLLKAVPLAEQKSAGFLFAKAMWLRKTENWKDAAAMMALAPRDAASLIAPDAWWTERRILARNLVDAGQPRLAYETAALHAAQSPSAAAEAEFHAGWIALRALNDPKLAATHFRRLLDYSAKPQSASRGYYWLGRAQQAAGGDPMDAYRKAAHFGTNFYGQLAAAKIGAAALDIPDPEPTAHERARFEGREAVAAIRRLEAAGHGTRARTLYFMLSEELDSTGELALLAAEADRANDHFTALKVGKIAAGARLGCRCFVASARRDPGKRQHCRIRQSAGLCDCPSGERVQQRRGVESWRAWPFAIDAGNSQGNCRAQRHDL